MTPAQLAKWGYEARAAAEILAQTDAETRTVVITAIVAAVCARSAVILAANATDVERALADGMAPAQLDRWRLMRVDWPAWRTASTPSPLSPIRWVWRRSIGCGPTASTSRGSARRQGCSR